MYNCFIFLQYKQREKGSSYLSKIAKDIEMLLSAGIKARLLLKEALVTENNKEKSLNIGYKV